MMVELTCEEDGDDELEVDGNWLSGWEAKISATALSTRPFLMTPWVNTRYSS